MQGTQRGQVAAMLTALGVLVPLVLMDSAAAMGTTAEALLRAASHDQFERTMRNMTIDSAIEIVRHKFEDGELPALLQMGNFQDHRVHRHHQLRQERSRKDVANSVAMLNKMITESEKKLDLETVKCSEYIQTQEELMEVTRQDISTYSAMSAAARGKILGAMTTIEMIEMKLPQLKDGLKDHLEKCATDRAALKAQLHILKGDSDVMGTILGLVNCPTLLLQCNQGAASAFSHRIMRAKLAQLQSAETRKSIESILLQTSAARHHRHHRTPTTAPTATTTLIPPAGAQNTTDDPDPSKAARKCSISGSPSCILLRDRFLDIQSDMMDKIGDLEEAISKLNDKCEETKKNFEAQTADMETRLKGSQTDLADATETQNQAEEQGRLKAVQLTEVQKDLLKEKKRCKEAITNLQNEVCGLKKIRQELLKIKSQPLFIQDCEVSKWTPEECSATCGGGVQKLTRTIVMPPKGGAACPPLEMERKCNSQECPINCQLSRWSGWSSCSAKCGGGVQQRTRSVRVEPQHGGEPCGETSQTSGCNVQSCDVPCRLSKWTGWTSCSKACGGGFQRSSRYVTRRARAQGFCPSARSRLRLKFKKCNSHECKPATAVLQCAAKTDVIILLDGSGSLGPAGWAATKVAGKMLVEAFKGGDSQVGVVLFSGPKTSSNLRKCFRGQQASMSDCGIEWVDHFQHGAAKLTALAAKIEGLAWPSATTFTSMAIAAAAGDLRNGRGDAQSLVIVVTDGRPMSARRTYQASRDLRKKARLMWVAVGRNVPLKRMKYWASKPARDNLIAVEDFNGLKSPKVISDIVSNACPKVK